MASGKNDEIKEQAVTKQEAQENDKPYMEKVRQTKTIVYVVIILGLVLASSSFFSDC
jgi:hypothetical protein